MPPQETLSWFRCGAALRAAILHPSVEPTLRGLRTFNRGLRGARGDHGQETTNKHEDIEHQVRKDREEGSLSVTRRLLNSGFKFQVSGFSYIPEP